MLEKMRRRIAMSLGKEPADLLIENALLVDVLSGRIRKESVAVGCGVIVGFGEREAKERFDAQGKYLLPGFIDPHIHIESSMLAPDRFCSLVLPRGTTSVVADPHEIANVSGADGIRYFLDSAKQLPLNIFVSLPSCVPAAPFEDAGAVMDSKEMAPLAEDSGVASIGEMMNYPGVLAGDEECLRKVLLGLNLGKPVTGHSPMLMGKELDAYTVIGINSDHESSVLEEARQKLERGMYLFVRQGSAAKNLLDLLPCITPESERRCSFCTDDRTAADLLESGHIDNILRLAVAGGLPPMTAVRMATINPAEASGLRGKGALAPGWDADMVLVDDLSSFKVRRTWVSGNLVAEEGKVLREIEVPVPAALLDSVHLPELSETSFDLKVPSGKARVIALVPGSLVTEERVVDVPLKDGGLVDMSKMDGICKLAVIERHKASGKIGVGLLAGYGLKRGAVALSVAHDSHNVVVAGVSEKAMLRAVEELAHIHGGCVLADEKGQVSYLPLPVGGLMSDTNPQGLSSKLAGLVDLAHEYLGVDRDVSPFAALSFMALPVIPSLKLTARGLFDVRTFSFTEVEVK